MSVKKSLLKNTAAGLWSKGSSIFFRLIQVPLLLSFLGVDDFGRWLVIYSLPSWLTLANMGFGSVASNEMSMAASAKDFQRAREVFSTVLAIVVLIGLIGSVLLVSGAFFIPWNTILKDTVTRSGEFSRAIIFLGLTVFVSFSFEAFGGRFRAAHKAHVSVLVASFLPWINLLGMFISLQFSKRFDHLAFSQLVSTAVFFLVYQWMSWRVMPELSFSLKAIKLKGSSHLFRKGLAFQAFPLGNALIFQGNIFIVQLILGPAAVTVFGTVRTLVRTVNQVMEMINQAIWPEMSHFFGVNDFTRAAKLHRIAVGLSVSLSILGVIGLLFLGKPIYTFWVGKEIALPHNLLFLFLFSIPFNSLWLTSSVVHMASNKHEGLAVRYLIGTVISALACGILSYWLGLEGAAISTIIVDLILIPYVVRKSMQLTHDNWKDFIDGIFTEFKAVPGIIRRYVNG
ncbi:MAG: lipopolysaccharide biosynthesis protein, partial [Chitinophagaceae bacterium]